MDFKELSLTGCYEITPKIFQDERGEFITTFSRDLFDENGVDVNFVQENFSVSKQGVLRGLHFQTPPFEQAKLIYCAVGEVLDVLLDLRVGSPSYGQVTTINLNTKNHNMVFASEGIAHGFYTLSSSATIIYKTSEVYAPEHDQGVLWSSVDVWPDANPILSDRDQQHPTLKDFDSPFHYVERGEL